MHEALMLIGLPRLLDNNNPFKGSCHCYMRRNQTHGHKKKLATRERESTMISLKYERHVKKQ